MKGLIHMIEINGFYTQKVFQSKPDKQLTASMEDYLEMICRLLQNESTVRIKELSQLLHVKPSSASKMANNLKEAGLVSFERYGEIILTEQGRNVGDYLLRRHTIVHEFLCLLNGSENELEQTEKMEHFLNENTVDNLGQLIVKMRRDKNAYNEAINKIARGE